MNEEIIFINNSIIKSLDEEIGEIGSHSIIYGRPDLKDFHGNWFTKKTMTGHFVDGKKYDIGLINHRVPMFQSGQFDNVTEKALKKISDMTFKNPVVTEVDEVGEFSRLVLDLSDKYEKMVYELAKQGVFKWSSGSAPQTYKSLPTGELELFVPVERSLTPIPAEGRMLEHRVMPLKAYTEFLKHGNVTDEKSGKLVSINTFLRGYSLDNFVYQMEKQNIKHLGPGNHSSGSNQNVHSGSKENNIDISEKEFKEYIEDYILKNAIKNRFTGKVDWNKAEKGIYKFAKQKGFLHKLPKNSTKIDFPKNINDWFVSVVSYIETTEKGKIE